MKLKNALVSVALTLLYHLSAWGQAVTGQAVNQVAGPPLQPYVGLLYYDGSNNLQYVCKALQIQGRTLSLSPTNIVVTSTTTATMNFASAHKLYVGTRLVVAGSATTTLNGTFSVSSVTSTALVFTVPTTSNATYTDFTSVTTKQPLTSDAVWSIQIFTNPSNLLSSYYFATPNGTLPPGSGTPSNAVCDDRATY